MKNKRLILIICMLVLFTGAIGLKAYLAKAQTQTILTIPDDGEPNRILLDPSAEGYWVVNRGSGLIFLNEDQLGWHYSLYNIGIVMDATGPDPNGLIYCSFRGNAPMFSSGVYVFDTATRSVVDTIVLDHYPFGLVLSSDGEQLYVDGDGWPAFGELFSIADANEHPDSGILWRIDLATRQITGTISVGALPTSIYTFPTERGDRLFVTQQESGKIETNDPIPLSMGTTNKIDIVDASSFTRIATLETPEAMWDEYPYAMLNWPQGLVAVCCPVVWDPIEDHPEFQDAIWLVDPVSATIVNRIHVTDGNGIAVGVFQTVVSQVYPDQAYMSIGPFQGPGSPTGSILVVAYPSGQYIRSISTTGTGCRPYFMHEIPEGRLIVTGGVTGKILIIDPSS